MLVENIIPLPQIFVEILLKIKKLGCLLNYQEVLVQLVKEIRVSLFLIKKIQAEGLGDFFRGIGKAAKSVGKKILNNPGRALELAANIGTAAASKNPKLIAATAPDIIKFVHQGKGLYLGQIH